MIVRTVTKTPMTLAKNVDCLVKSVNEQAKMVRSHVKTVGCHTKSVNEQAKMARRVAKTARSQAKTVGYYTKSVKELAKVAKSLVMIVGCHAKFVKEQAKMVRIWMQSVLQSVLTMILLLLYGCMPALFLRQTEMANNKQNISFCK